MGMLLNALAGAAQTFNNNIAPAMLKDIDDEKLRALAKQNEIEKENRIEEAKIREENRAKIWSQDPNNPGAKLNDANIRNIDSQIASREFGDKINQQNADSTTSNAESSRMNATTQQGMLALQRENSAYSQSPNNPENAFKNEQVKGAKTQNELSNKILQLKNILIDPARTDAEKNDAYQQLSFLSSNGNEPRYETKVADILDNEGNATGAKGLYQTDTRSGETKLIEGKGSSGNNKPFSHTDDKNLLKEFIIQHESSNKSDAQNERSTAGGLGQMTDSTALEFGAKMNADGTISYEEKNKAFDRFYRSNYEKFDGDPLKIITAQFGQNAVNKAVIDANKQKNPDDWFNNIKSSDISNEYKKTAVLWALDYYKKTGKTMPTNFALIANRYL